MKLPFNYSAYYLHRQFFTYCFSLWFPPIFLLLFIFPSTTYSQQLPCYFDEHMEYLIETDPEFEEILLMNEDYLQEMMHNNPEAIMNSSILTVPVVFHVIHHSYENVGVGSNILDSRIYQALQDLNDYFRDVQDLGTDVEIEFCLAVRDPEGGFTTGINRVNGDGVPYFLNSGLIQGQNEDEVKSLSRWPNDQYLNIWVVGEIESDPNIVTLGFATFPGTNSQLDGVVLISDATGLNQYATVIPHEVGHFLNLYHTFHGGNSTTCASDVDCHYDGDKCCDTDPHKLLTSGCDENETNDCATPPLGDLVHNHMSYFPATCHYLFKGEQIMRMRGALMGLRASLLESLGCVPDCDDVTADFTSSDVTVSVGNSLTFANTTIPGQSSYTWIVEDQEFNSTNLTYYFNNLGSVLVCLRATYNGCINEHCELIQVDGIDDCSNPILPECELLYNGTFERNNVQIGVVDHFSGGQQLNNNKVCNWINKEVTPFFCSNLYKDVFGIYSASEPFQESIVTQMEVPFVDGHNYKVTFEYYTGNNFPTLLNLKEPTLVVGLSHSSALHSQLDDEIIEVLPNLSYDDYDVHNHECLNPTTNFHYHEFTFPYTSDMGKHLYFWNLYTEPDNQSIIFIRDVHVPECLSCIPVPDFEFEIDDCSVQFEGESIGEEALWYKWDFGDGITSSNQNVTHEYLFPGIFNVCLTAACDLEISATECKEIEITGPCTDCTELPGVTATACSVDESTVNVYLANFSVEIPDGYKICEGSDFFIYSGQVSIEVSSFEIIDVPSDDDLLNVGVIITSSLLYDFLQTGAKGYFILCNDEDEQFCFTIRFSGEACDLCLNEVLPSIVTCNEVISDVSTYVYDGTIIITLSDPILTYSGFESLELGFEVLSTSHSGNDWTIQYRITTENLFFNSTNVIFYFTKIGVKACVSALIIVSESCSELPSECAEEWDTKELTCAENELVEDYLFFPAFTMYVPNNGYTICDGGLFGTIDGGGTVEVTHAQIQGQYLSFSLNIWMPENYNTHITYDLRIYLCNNRGEMVCYLFPLELICNLGSFQNPIIPRSTADGMDPNLFSLYPNPAYSSITIEYPGFDPVSRVDIELIDLTGQIILNNAISSNITVVDVSNLTGGIYFVRLKKNGSTLSTQKVVLLQ